jgi:hypothetical protein
MARAGTLEVVALLDASGPFSESWTRAFPNGTDEDFARARIVDPEAFGDDGLWHLDFHCFAIRRPGGHVTLIDTGVGPADSPASAWAPVPGVLPDALTAAGIGVDDVDFVVLSTSMRTTSAGSYAMGRRCSRGRCIWYNRPSWTSCAKTPIAPSGTTQCSLYWTPGS